MAQEQRDDTLTTIRSLHGDGVEFEFPSLSRAADARLVNQVESLYQPGKAPRYCTTCEHLHPQKLYQDHLLGKELAEAFVSAEQKGVAPVIPAADPQLVARRLTNALASCATLLVSSKKTSSELARRERKLKSQLNWKIRYHTSCLRSWKRQYNQRKQENKRLRKQLDRHGLVPDLPPGPPNSDNDYDSVWSSSDSPSGDNDKREAEAATTATGTTLPTTTIDSATSSPTY